MFNEGIFKSFQSRTKIGTKIYRFRMVQFVKILKYVTSRKLTNANSISHLYHVILKNK